MSDTTTRAACLTPPAAGGVAVIQIVGPAAAELVNPLLRSKRPLELKHFDPQQLRLCQFVDGEEIIDDALVCVRRTEDGSLVIDLSVHGGPRIVQRALLALKRAGASIVDPAELLERSCPPENLIERDLMRCLPHASTRSVARWMLRMQKELPRRAGQIAALLRDGRSAEAAGNLTQLAQAWRRARYLLEGLRVVLVGEPNVGKSTLANALAGREHAIVSEVPGTTRDYTEHPGAVDGVPFTFVDTAGIRETNDSLEREAILRTHQQVERGSIVLNVLDGSASPPPSPIKMLIASPCVLVLNKSDLPVHSAWKDMGPEAIAVSAFTGQGLNELRRRLLEIADLAGWADHLIAPLSAAQTDVIHQAMRHLEANPPDQENALAVLGLLGADALPSVGI